MHSLHSQNDYALAERIEYDYLHQLSPGQTSRDFLELFDTFHHQFEDNGSLDDEHRAALIQIQARLAKIGHGSTSRRP